MAAAPWPVGLQQKVNRDGFNYNFGDSRLRSENDTGADKVRLLYTDAIDVMSVSFNFKKAEYAIWRNFWDLTLGRGVMPFTFTNPLTDALDTWRVLDTPKVVALGGLAFQVSMTWERLP